MSDSAGKLRFPRKFVVCCDGTWLDSDNGLKEGHLAPPSNVTRLSRALKPIDDQGRPQIVYYQSGIGTGWTIDNQLFGGALGLGLSANIREAYEFLATNYTAGDEIFLTGFSRGAFTARSVGGLISSMGLLEKQAATYFPYVFLDWENTLVKGYITKANSGIPGFHLKSKADQPSYQNDYMAELKRLGLTREVNIKAIGVWDTVGALGIPITPWLQYLGFPSRITEFKFYDTALDNHIEHAFQALALDEHRSPYAPSIWNKQDGSTTELVQCWFPGVHSNIGGAYPDNGIGELTLAWMMSKLSPFLDFEPGVMERVRARNDGYLLQTNGSQYMGWADGKIINSAKFPRSLLGIMARTPGQYHGTNLMTGRAIESQPKLKTNEHIHASVRARIQAKATTVGGTGKDYFPKALERWRVEAPDGKATPYGNASWVYTGPEHGPQLLGLPEDKLGDVELELLSLCEKSSPSTAV